jgi:molybdopterin converting factor subunit 1
MGDIRVRVKVFASIRDVLGKGEFVLLLPEGSSVESLIKYLKAKYPQIADILDCSFIALNEEYALREASLRGGDTLAIIPPVSGG